MNHSFDVDHATEYGVVEAVLISNFQFWISKNRANGKHLYDGRTWTYNSVRAFSDLFPYLSAKQVRRAIEHLVEDAVLVKGNYNESQIDQTTWYAFADEIRFLGEFSDSPKKANGDAQKGKPFAQNGKSTNKTDINTDINTDISSGNDPDRLFESAWQAYPSRPGASKKDSKSAWDARLKSGADPQKIIDGVKRYAAYVAALKTEAQYIKQPKTFFGPGEHYLADWTPPTSPAPGYTSSGKFDAFDYVNSGAAYGTGNAGNTTQGGNQFTIDAEAQFVECAARTE